MEQRSRALAAQSRAEAEKQRADTEADTARATSDFLQNDQLKQARPDTQTSPTVKPDPEIKVRTALDRAAGRITGKFSTKPLVEASIRRTIGNAYIALGLFNDAQRQLEPLLLSGYQGMAEREQAIPIPNRPAITEAVRRIVQFYQDWGKPEKTAEWQAVLKVRDPDGTVR